jgi:long-chain fatty acid transport protein
MRHRSAALASRLWLAGALLIVGALLPLRAQAGGMFLTDRGTRASGRGFALVAGTDDADALWYNPAGLAFAREQFFFDATLTLFDADYARVDSGGNSLPSEELSHPPLPIPMIGYTSDFGVEDWSFGFAVLAPNLVQYDWSDARDAPQRYSLISLAGSVIGRLAVGAAWQPIPELSLGLTGHLLVGNLRARVALSACDGVVCSQPENPEWDGVAEVDSLVLSPTATLGAIYATGPVKLGASFSLPYSLGGPATLRVRLPEAALFDGASVDGDDADVTLDMPWIARLGVEVSPMDGLRAELAGVYEAWSVQDAMIVDPNSIWLRNVTAVGDYEVGPVNVPRNMKDVVSVRLGGEYDLTEHVTLRAGASYETSAFDDEYLSVLTLDSTKLITGLGVSVLVTEGVWIDASYVHVFLANRNVENSRVPQANPIRPPSPGEPTYIGNGSYKMEANMFGLGLRWMMASAPDTTGT